MTRSPGASTLITRASRPTSSLASLRAQRLVTSWRRCAGAGARAKAFFCNVLRQNPVKWSGGALQYHCICCAVRPRGGRVDRRGGGTPELDSGPHHGHYDPPRTPLNSLRNSAYKTGGRFFVNLLPSGPRGSLHRRRAAFGRGRDPAHLRRRALRAHEAAPPQCREPGDQYNGYLSGYVYAYEAASDPAFVEYLVGYMNYRARPTFGPVPRGRPRRLCTNTDRAVLQSRNQGHYCPLVCVQFRPDPEVGSSSYQGQPGVRREITRATAIVASWARYAERD